MNTTIDDGRPSAQKVADALLVPRDLGPTLLVEAGSADLRNAGGAALSKANDAIYEALETVHPDAISGQVLLKVHVGEPRWATRMNPAYMESSVRFAQEHGASGVAVGDTTVAYTGPRGHRKNPMGDASTYVRLARRHGWSTEGDAGAPFVVLDRPSTAVPGLFEFQQRQQCNQLDGICRFKDFYLAGGFAAADFVVNHAHLTLHALAGVAGCVKSIAMGCSALRGKLRMHQSLLPEFDSEACTRCGRCVESCPEGALRLDDDALCPAVDPELCIGCGECEAVCTLGRGAITLQGEDITDWQRGEDTLPLRMADYAMGLMNGKWEHTVHVLHMYSVTERCDCVDARQEPMLKHDLGFLVGRNPFAIDQIAADLLADALRSEGRPVDQSLLRTAARAASHVEDAYGMSCESRLLEARAQ
ncbi:MAG: DUF362 domain-containing protein [Armatimonadota bacterium]